MFAACPHLALIDQILPADSRRNREARGARRRQDRQGALRRGHHRLLSHQPDRARIRDHGELERDACGERGTRRPAPMAEFWSSYGLPIALIIGQSLLLLVILLIIVAFLLYADRKVWAAVQMRRGPNVVGPFGLLQSFADLLKFVFKEPIIPAGANKGIFLLAPHRYRGASAVGLGGHSGRRRLGGRQHQCRHSLHLRHLILAGLRRDHGGLGLQLQICVPRLRCARRRRWSPMKSRSALSSSPCCSVPARSISTTS